MKNCKLFFILLLLLNGCGKSAPEELPPTSEPVFQPPAGMQATPLNPVKKQTGSLFEKLSSEFTGIDFKNALEERHLQAYLYAEAYQTGGVAIGDLDGDQKADIFFTSGPGKNRLFKQTDDWKFTDITEQAGILESSAWSAGTSFLDIEGDGDLDIYICNYDAPNQLYVNAGDGTFTEEGQQRGVDILDASHTPSFCDYDRDGDLDLYIVTNKLTHPQGRLPQMVSKDAQGNYAVRAPFLPFYKLGKSTSEEVVLEFVGREDFLLNNDGTGHFSEVSTKSGIYGKGHGLSASWFDFNQDGWFDLYVANDFDDPDRLYRNNGDGTFTNVIEAVVPYTSWFSMGSDPADLNNDGLVDIVIADMSGSNHYKQKTAMGAMGAKAEFLATAIPRQYMRNVVFINSGQNAMMEAGYMTGLDSSDWTWSVQMDDFDNDGLVDAFFTNGSSRNFNDSDNEAVFNIQLGETRWKRHLKAGTPPLIEQNRCMKNIGDLKFKDTSKQWGLNHAGMSFGTAAGDIDQDGDLDLIVINLDEEVHVYRNNSSGNHRAIFKLKGISSNSYGIGALISIRTQAGLQSKQLIPVSGYKGSNEPIVHFGLNSSERIEELTIEWPSGIQQKYTDLPVDYLFTITEPASEAKKPSSATKADKHITMFHTVDTLANAVHKETPYDDYVRQPLLPYKHSQLGPGHAWGDANGDGYDDLFLCGAKGEGGELLLKQSDGSFVSQADTPMSKDAQFEDMSALWFDVDQDGDQDLYVVSGGVECEPGDQLLKDRLYLNQGGATFLRSEQHVPDIRESGSIVSAADYDQDGDLDLFIGSRVIPGKYPLSPRSHLLQNNQGKLVDVTQDLAPELLTTGLITSALWSDADGDGWVDLLLTHEWGTVKLFKNDFATSKKLIEHTNNAGLDIRLGWYNSITGGDVDNDGDIDYVVTNFGLNTKYHASLSKPASLYYGDFEGDGNFRLVEAEYEGEQLFPVRGRSCSTSAIPHLGEKFTSFHDFALAELPQIYQPQRLKAAKQFLCNSLESVLLINNGKGQFEFQTLPRITQISPGYGISLTDFNGDQFLDLVIAQNFYSPQVETGRMSGGLSQLLLGDGTGHFEPVWPNISGLVIPKDAKSLTITDLNDDAWPDLVVGINDEKMIAYENRSSRLSDNRVLAVQLQGRAGNLNAVGAKVTLKSDNGVSQVKEIYGGDGYLSQSSATLFFGLSTTTDSSLSIEWPDGELTEWNDNIPADGKLMINQPVK